MAILHKNFAQTTLAAAITTTGETSITVTSEASFPAVDFIISIDTEAMLVTNVSTTTWTVTRGYEGSTAATHLNGAAIYHDWSAAEADSTVHGPASVTTAHIAQFDGTTGKLLKDGGVLGTMAAATATDYVAKASYDAQTVMVAHEDNAPEALSVSENTVVGRLTGDVTALSKSNLQTLLGITAAGAALIDDANAAAQLTTLGALPLAGGTMTGNIVMPNDGSIGQAAGPLLVFDDTNNQLEINGANVGINTVAPTSRLHIREAAASNALLFETYSDTVGHNTQITFNHSLSNTPGTLVTTTDTSNLGTFLFQGVNANGTPAIALGAALKAQQIGAAGTGANTVPAALIFMTSNATAFAERARFSPAGNLGIGTTAGLSALSINGGLHVGGDSDAGNDNALIDGTLEVTGITTLTGQTNTVAGVHVGGTSDPGADNLIVDGTATITGTLAAGTTKEVNSNTTLASTTTVKQTAASGATGGAILFVTQDDAAATASGDRLAVIGLCGAKDNAHAITCSAAIQAFADETWEATKCGAHLEFQTTPLASVTRATAMSILNTGGVTIPIGGLHVGGTSDAGTDNLLVDGTGVITGAFGCNGKTAQAGYANAPWDEPGAGAFGVDSAAHMAALVELVKDMQAALVANGILATPA